MAIDLGNSPVGTAPTPEQSQQIKNVLGLAPTSTEILSAMAGEANNNTKIGSEYMPEILADTNIQLQDTSTITLPAGTLGADAFGNPVVHDGFTVGGKNISDPTTTKFSGTVVLTDEELDTQNARLLGEFPLSSINAVAGVKIRMRGRVWAIHEGSSSTTRIGISTTRQRVVTSNTIINSTLSGPNLAITDPDMTSTSDIDITWVLATSGNYLNLTNLSGTTPNVLNGFISAGIVSQTATTATIFGSSLFTPNQSEAVRLYIGWGSSLGTIKSRISYDITITVSL